MSRAIQNFHSAAATLKLQDVVVGLSGLVVVVTNGPILLLLLGQTCRAIFTLVFHVCWLFIAGWMLHLGIVAGSALWNWSKGDWDKLKLVFEKPGRLSRSTSTFLSSSVKRHLLTVLGSDLMLIVGKTDHVREFPVHRKVLCAVSEVAASMITTASEDHDRTDGGNDTSRQVLRLPDENPDTVDLFIKFIYSNSWKSNLSVKEAVELALFAERYKVQVLQDRCKWYFINDVLSEGTACRMYELASHLKYANLKELCLLIFVTRTDAILSQESFTECRSMTVLCIVEQTCLNLLSGEIGLLVALTKWAKKKCERKAIFPSGQNACRVLQPFLPYINISEIPPQEFLARIAGEVLPENEALSFVEELFSAKHKCVLPHLVNFKRTKICFRKLRIGVSDGRCKKRVWVAKNIIFRIKVHYGNDVLLTGIQYLLDRGAEKSGKQLRLTVRDVGGSDSDKSEYLLKERKCRSFVIPNLKSTTHVLRTPYPLVLKTGLTYELTCEYRGYVWYMNNKLAKDSIYVRVVENPTCCVESLMAYTLIDGAVGS